MRAHEAARPLFTNRNYRNVAPSLTVLHRYPVFYIILYILLYYQIFTTSHASVSLLPSGTNIMNTLIAELRTAVHQHPRKNGSGKKLVQYCTIMRQSNNWMNACAKSAAGVVINPQRGWIGSWIGLDWIGLDHHNIMYVGNNNLRDTTHRGISIGRTRLPRLTILDLSIIISPASTMSVFDHL